MGDALSQLAANPSIEPDFLPLETLEMDEKDEVLSVDEPVGEVDLTGLSLVRLRILRP